MSTHAVTPLRHRMIEDMNATVSVIAPHRQAADDRRWSV